jgi:NAD-dependent SIR2 family protein deacetylase
VNTLQQDIDTLSTFLATHPRLLILTGAGISFDSGIPTYRDREGNWLYRTPIQEQAFLEDDLTRRRYWARSWYGWPTIRDATPNAAHTALVKLEELGYIELLITQNVDRLHQQAGSRKVVDLHGRVDRARCLRCNAVHSRELVQGQLQAGFDWPDYTALAPRPDGDMEISEEILFKFEIPRCEECGGDLMPDVVFFGGSVPPSRVNQCLGALEQADALLAIGSSLTVFSGYRFCRRASQLGKPVALVNPGVTRADPISTIKISAEASPLLRSAIDYLEPIKTPRSSSHDSPS